MENLENRIKEQQHKYLVDGKYSFKDLVDIDRLRVMFERFSQATGFTTGLISYPDQHLLISTGWRDICTRFHRNYPSSNIHCKQSNLTLTSNLKERKALNILHCESGLVDGATPIIIKGAHVANLATGQILFKKPDIKQFRKQSKEYGYDVEAYLEALKKVPVVTEKKFKEALEFLSEMAVMLAEQGLTELQICEAAQTVYKSEVKFRGIFENVQDVFFEITLEKVILEVSPSIENLSKGQYKREYLIGKSLSELFSNPEERKILLEELYKSGSVTDYEIDFSNRDGSIIPCSISARIQYDKAGRPYKIIISTRDISQRKLVEKALKESEEKYKNIVENIADVVFVLDSEGFIKYLSSNIKTVLGYSSESTINKHFTKYVYPNDIKKSIEGFQSHMKGGVIPQEFRMVNINGELIWVSTLGKPIKGKKGIIFSGVLRDITDRKQAEEYLKIKNQELIEAKEKAEESDRLKTAFLHNISHEIRTPMNGILGFSDILLEPGLSGEEQHEYIEIIKNNSDRMLNTINDLMDISMIESDQMKISVSEVNLNKQNKNLYSFFKPEAEKKGMNLKFINSLPVEAAIIESDREKIYAILSNLIKNAIKYSNEGIIEFGYNLKYVDQKTVGEPNESAELEFFVKDKGMGIPKDRQQAIFERFVQADIEDNRVFEGSGLGLSISKAYAEMLGGRIWVESEEGVGSQFYFTTPYNPKIDRKIGAIDETPGKKIENQITGLKILIAEDVESADKHLSIVIKKISKEILHTKTGIKTVELCRKNPDIDLILMDIRMPEMNGYEATRKIREFNKNVIIIAQTAYALAGDCEKAFDAGCDDYISKPIKKNELIDIIIKHINAKMNKNGKLQF